MKYRLQYRRWQLGYATVEADSLDEAEDKANFRRIKVDKSCNDNQPNEGWELWDATPIKEE